MGGHVDSMAALVWIGGTIWLVAALVLGWLCHYEVPFNDK